MSMNFAREQSLLRQKLQAKASPDLAAARGAQLPGVTFLGAPDAEIAAAAAALAAAYPQMGRAQMTAFVRTLWQSRIHELRAVGVQLLAARAHLLEPADLPLFETFLGDVADDAVMGQLAREVVGAIVGKNKKLWKDLKRFAGAERPTLRLAAVRAAARPLGEDAEAFPRFAELVAPLLAVADTLLQAAIDDVLVAAAALHHEAASAFVQQHGRAVALPKPQPKVVAVPPPPAAEPAPAKARAGKPVAAVAAKAATGTAAAKKPAPKKAAVKKPGTDKPAAGKPAARKPAARKPAKA